MRTQRVVVAAASGLGALLVVASVAWACTSFSTITPSATSGEVGTRISVSGADARADAPVTLRWDSRQAPVAAQTQADAQGAFQASVEVPDVAPGVHVLLATDGEGVVARAAFEVVGAPGAERLATPVSGTTEPAGNDVLRNGLLVALGAMALLPLAGLAVLGARRSPALAAGAGRGRKA